MGLLGAAAARAHEPITTKLTWTQEISRIVYKRCASCHREGGAAFSLLSYEDARPWAKAIREEVLERRMPPWGAVEGIRAYRDDPSLTPIEIESIVSWVEGGAPEGDGIYLPATPSLHGPETNTQAGAPVSEIVVGSADLVTLRETTMALAVAPRDLADGATMEVSAYEPDGSIDHLIWLRNYRNAWARAYWFREPLRLPAGTRLVVDAPAHGAAVLSVSRR